LGGLEIFEAAQYLRKVMSNAHLQGGRIEGPKSGTGQGRLASGYLSFTGADVRFGSKGDIDRRPDWVCFAPQPRTSATAEAM
jgi:hypothetical protein